MAHSQIEWHVLLRYRVAGRVGSGRHVLGSVRAESRARAMDRARRHFPDFVDLPPSVFAVQSVADEQAETEEGAVRDRRFF